MTEPAVYLDLHIHSALSPCAAEEMRPPAVLLAAEQRGIAVLALVDHNSAGNARAFQEAAEAFAVRVLVGLEIESTEGVHLLALFDTAAAALRLEEALQGRRPPLANDRGIFGDQLLLDEWGEPVGEVPELLLGATDLPLEKIADLTHALGGLSIPAHVDRTAWGLLPTLGFLPPGLHVDLLELSPRISPGEARDRWPELRDWPLLQSSDAHRLAEIGRAPTRVSRALALADLPLPEWGQALAAELLSRGEPDA